MLVNLKSRKGRIMIISKKELKNYLVDKLQTKYGVGCRKHYVALSGGVDSSLVASLLCWAFGTENVVAMYRNLHSNPIHWQHAQALQKKFGFKLIYIDANPLEEILFAQMKEQFELQGLRWEDGSVPRAKAADMVAFSSGRSRFNTWASGIISKKIDNGRGRIYGTGNGEEDYILRYFDKFGDGAVDNNILAGLNKAEVRQLALYIGVPREIVVKTPSADLEACGDGHNDEDQLTAWARNKGYDIKISYGAPDGSEEGNVAWAWRETLEKHWLESHEKPSLPRFDGYGYTKEQIDLICFLYELRQETNHKVLGIPGTSRSKMMRLGLVY